MVYLTFLLVCLYTMKHTANVKNNPQSKDVQGDFLAGLGMCFLLFVEVDFIRLCCGSPPNVRPYLVLCDEQHLPLAYV